MSYSYHLLPEFARGWARAAIASHKAAEKAMPSIEEFADLAEWLRAVALTHPSGLAGMQGAGWSYDVGSAAAARWHRQEALDRTPARFVGRPDDAQTVFPLPDGWRWVQITSPGGMEFEDDAMQRLPGGSAQWRGGRYPVYSLRDLRNLPHCTLEWDPATRIVRYILGRPQRPIPETLHDMIARFVTSLHPEDVYEARMFGHLFASVNQEPRRLLHWRDLQAGDTVNADVNLAQVQGDIRLPQNLKVRGYLNLAECGGLKSLPDGLDVGHLELRDCVGLERLGRGTVVRGSLNLHSCPGLQEIPGDIQVHGRVILDPDKENLLAHTLPGLRP